MLLLKLLLQNYSPIAQGLNRSQKLMV